MPSRTWIAAGVAGCFVVGLTVLAAQQPAPQPAQGTQPQAGRGGQPAAPGQQPPAAGPAGQTAAGRGGQPATPPPMPGGLPPRPQTEADLLNDKGGIPEGFTQSSTARTCLAGTSARRITTGRHLTTGSCTG